MHSRFPYLEYFLSVESLFYMLIIMKLINMAKKTAQCTKLLSMRSLGEGFIVHSFILHCKMLFL